MSEYNVGAWPWAAIVGQTQPPHTHPYDAPPSRGPRLAPTDPAALQKEVQLVYPYLVNCLKNLDAAGASNEAIVNLLLYLAIMEAAEFGYTARIIQDLTAGLFAARSAGRPAGPETLLSKSLRAK